MWVTVSFNARFKPHRGLVLSPRSLNNFWNFARYANRRCMGHATTSAERGNDRLITVHAPFLVLAIAPNLNGEITRDNQRIGRELMAFSLQATQYAMQQLKGWTFTVTYQQQLPENISPRCCFHDNKSLLRFQFIYGKQSQAFTVWRSFSNLRPTPLITILLRDFWYRGLAW